MASKDVNIFIQNAASFSRPTWLPGNLAAGLYVRHENALLPATFSSGFDQGDLDQTFLDWKKDRTLADLYDTQTAFPDTNFVIDRATHSVWMDQGRYKVSMLESNREGAELYNRYALTHAGGTATLSGGYERLKHAKRQAKVQHYSLEAVSGIQDSLTLRSMSSVAIALLSIIPDVANGKADLGPAPALTFAKKRQAGHDSYWVNIPAVRGA